MVLRIGHRGACGYEPENTMKGFQKAIDLSADMIEMDVHISKDNHAIVIHDETLNRTTNGKGYVRDKTLNEIKKYKADKNEDIPTLDQVFSKFSGKIKFNVEVKGIKPALLVADLIKKHNLESDALISSNHIKSLSRVKSKLPDIQTALVYYATKNEFRQAIYRIFSFLIWPYTKHLILKKVQKAKVDSITLYYPFATKSFLKKLQSLGYKINVFPVNNKKLAIKMKNRGVDGMFLNCPDMI